MKNLEVNNKRTISYDRCADPITREVRWEPRWELSQRPPVCFYCQRRGTEYCAEETAPAWYGAKCANWLPREVMFSEVYKAVEGFCSNLTGQAKHTWCENYAAALENFILSVYEAYFSYLEKPFWSDEEIAAFRQGRTAFVEERRKRQRYAQRG